MNAVEQVVDALERPDPDMEKQERVEAALDEQKAESKTTSENAGMAGTPDNSGVEALNTLLTGGAQFLLNLSRAISQPAEHGSAATGKIAHNQGVSSLIGRDEATGNTYLKIPLPQPSHLGAWSAFGRLYKAVVK